MIVGDIGGTKTLLAYADEQGQAPDGLPQLSHIKRFANDEHDCFDVILSSYLMETGIEQPNAVVLSVAGPVANNHCQLTNLPWKIDAAHLAAEFKIPHLRLLNDLAATAYSIPLLPDSDFCWLHKSTPGELDTQSVMSVGTGLGEACLAYSPEENHHVVIPGEGGHKSFAPSNTSEQDLLTYYLDKRSHVSIECLVSGSGLQRIYQFLKDRPEWQDEAPTMEDADTAKNPNELITQLAFELPGSIYEETVMMFSRMLMSEAGNLALQTFSNGGVVIAGGIPPKIVPFLERESCLAAFKQKGRFSSWLKQLPLRVCSNTQAPLYGCWAYGKRYQKRNTDD